MKKTAVLVLAAGKSSRMKSIKQLAKIGHTYLLDIAITKALQIAPDSTFCVLGANVNTIQNKIDFKKVSTIVNNSFELGLSSSIVCGMNHIKNKVENVDGVLILLGDQPAIDVSYLQEIIALATSNPSKIIASKYHQNYGVPALIPKNYFEKILQIIGDKGAKAFLNSNTNLIITPNSSTNLTDIDTQKDLVSFLNLTK